jgi:hypothetical protein
MGKGLKKMEQAEQNSGVVELAKFLPRRTTVKTNR